MRNQKIVQIKKCALVGAGFMGSGIARLFSLYNIPTVLKDKDRTATQKGLEATTIEGEPPYERMKRIRRRRRPVSRFITPTIDYDSLKDADLIIEAVTEDADVKNKVFEEISAAASDKAIIASNSSAIPLSKISANVKNPQRFLGIHFFYPADKRVIVEVVRTKDTDPNVLAATVLFLRRLGKIPIVVNDGPGFLINRILVSYLTETAGSCLLEGMAVEDIDRMMIDFGMAVGPAFLMDLIGQELAYKVSKAVAEGINSPRIRLSPVMIKTYDVYRQGRYANYYIYKGKKDKVPNEAIYDIVGSKKKNNNLPREEHLKRVVYIIINEGAHCIEEGIADSPRTVDMGIILGMGFPFSKGGLLKYADTVGISRIVDTLDDFKKRFGERFEPCNLLKEMAAKGKRFYPRYDIFGVKPNILMELARIKIQSILRGRLK